MNKKDPKEIIESWLADVRRGSLSLYVLMLVRVLEKKDLSYGYMILKEIEKRSPSDWLLAEENTLYPLLRRLNQIGLLDKEKIGRKQHYLITPKGNQVLHLMKEYWDKIDYMMKELIEEEGTIE
ncbi:MAG: PadR family transcriptional regulator [Promethearchaeota archaeon]